MKSLMSLGVYCFQIFGCYCHVCVPKVLWTKLDAHSVEGVLCGFEPNLKAYRIWVPLKRWIMVSHDVIFYENVFNHHDDLVQQPASSEGVSRDTGIQSRSLSPDPRTVTPPSSTTLPKPMPEIQTPELAPEIPVPTPTIESTVMAPLRIEMNEQSQFHMNNILRWFSGASTCWRQNCTHFQWIPDVFC